MLCPVLRFGVALVEILEPSMKFGRENFEREKEKIDSVTCFELSVSTDIVPDFYFLASTLLSLVLSNHASIKPHFG